MLQTVWQMLRKISFAESDDLIKVQSETAAPVFDESYDQVISLLRSLATEQVVHVNGTLLPHLIGTYELLKKWGNPLELCHAGLCHAVYGTSGFELQLLTLAQRAQLREVIGDWAEEIVYFYASCDRLYVYPQIGVSESIQYRDRFTGLELVLDNAKLRQLLELTFANELELARADQAFLEHTRGSLGAMFARCEGLVSAPAFAYFKQVYGASKSENPL